MQHTACFIRRESPLRQNLRSQTGLPHSRANAAAVCGQQQSILHERAGRFHDIAGRCGTATASQELPGSKPAASQGLRNRPPTATPKNEAFAQQQPNSGATAAQQPPNIHPAAARQPRNARKLAFPLDYNACMWYILDVVKLPAEHFLDREN